MHSEVIRNYIKEKNITIEMFADLCKIHKLSVHAWLNGKHSIRPTTAAKIERRTKCQIKYEQLTDVPRKLKWMSSAQRALISKAIK